MELDIWVTCYIFRSHKELKNIFLTISSFNSFMGKYSDVWLVTIISYLYGCFCTACTYYNNKSQPPSTSL